MGLPSDLKSSFQGGAMALESVQRVIDHFADLDGAKCRCRDTDQGVVPQRYATREMLWSFGEVLEFPSQEFSFVPGDVIGGGTSAGTAADQ